jgi:hypothetical protein
MFIRYGHFQLLQLHEIFRILIRNVDIIIIIFIAIFHIVMCTPWSRRCLVTCKP